MPTQRNPNKKKTVLLLSFFFLFTVISVYFIVIDHTFISFDDPDYVTANHRVQQGLTPESIVWAFSFTKEGDKTYFHPLTWLSHMMDCQLFGLNPAYHHLTNLFFHIVNSFLLFMLLKISTGLPYRSLAVAVLFALHPICVDTVAWVAERKNLLSSFFWFLTILAYVWYTKKLGIIRYMAVFVLFILGLLSKPMLVTIPCVLFLMDFWPLERFQPVDVHSAIRDGAGLVKEKIPLFALSFFWSVLSMLSIQRLGVEVPTYSRPMDLRIANAIVSYVNYIGKILWPFDLAIFYPYPQHIPFWEIAIAMLVLISISYVVCKKIKDSPWLAVGWLWFLGTLVPVLGLTQNGLWPALADRWAYVPSIGIFIIIVWGIGEAINRTETPSALPAALAVIAFFAIVPATWTQVRYWSTNHTLFQHALNVTENNAVGHNNLGTALMEDKEYEKALFHFQRAEAIMHSLSFLSANVGIALDKIGKYSEAIDKFNTAIDKNPKNSIAFNKMGLTLKNKKNLKQAKKYIEKAILLDAAYTDAYMNMGDVLKEEIKYDEAMAYYKKALKLKPNSPDIYNNIGAVMFEQRKFDLAEIYYLKAIKLNSKLLGARNNLGLVFFYKGNAAKAIRHYKKSFTKNPDFAEYAEAYINVGNILKTQIKYDEAISYYKKALELKPDSPEVYNNIGAIMFTKKRLDEAEFYYLEALKLNPNFMEVQFNLALIYSHQGTLDKAIFHYQKASDIRPDSAGIHIKLGQALFQNNNLDEAIQHFRKALELNPNDPIAQISLQQSLERRRKKK